MFTENNKRNFTNSEYSKLSFTADTRADTSKEQAFYHMPGWLTIAEHMQTHYHARVLKNTCKQVLSFAQRWREWQLQQRVLNSKADKQIKSESKLRQVGIASRNKNAFV